MGVFLMMDVGYGIFIIGGGGGKICVWDVCSCSGFIIMKLFEAYNSCVRGLCLDDFFMFYFIGGDRLVKFWDFDYEMCKCEFIVYDIIVVDCIFIL